MHPLTRAAAGLTAVGAASLGYAVASATLDFRLRRVSVPVLPQGSRPLRVLHLSDLHITPSQTRKRAWVQSLADLRPDFVIDTGDNLAHLQAVPMALEALGPLLELPGAFVLGSNDYWAPKVEEPGALPAGGHAAAGTWAPGCRRATWSRASPRPGGPTSATREPGSRSASSIWSWSASTTRT